MALIRLKQNTANSELLTKEKALVPRVLMVVPTHITVEFAVDMMLSKSGYRALYNSVAEVPPVIPKLLKSCEHWKPEQILDFTSDLDWLTLSYTALENAKMIVPIVTIWSPRICLRLEGKSPDNEKRTQKDLDEYWRRYCS